MNALGSFEYFVSAVLGVSFNEELIRCVEDSVRCEEDRGIPALFPHRVVPVVAAWLRVLGYEVVGADYTTKHETLSWVFDGHVPEPRSKRVALEVEESVLLLRWSDVS